MTMQPNNSSKRELNASLININILVLMMYEYWAFTKHKIDSKIHLYDSNILKR